ncbi:unnamed protein product [Bursaphelenchus xylophilus]|uniref:(pine wood nematode) hypothetical protein n=1 Tax=Bursaphelenchus xylophilus TaxID=6326 RepID=A0A1I7RP94_BURXY|nr:unnamed protein product [Bursaphelenchus xylophilus]CAG9095628.1 unnamed protein product [Bursaphelenchus xylophilus]
MDKPYKPDGSSLSSGSDNSVISADSPTGAPVLRFMHKAYGALGAFIARHAVATIVITTIMTIVFGLVTLNTKKESDLLAYAPNGARSREEYNIYQEFFDNHGQGITMFILITPKDNGTMIRNEYLNASVQVLDTIYGKFKMPSKDGKKLETFPEFCMGFCQLNEPVRQFYNGFQIQNALQSKNQVLNPRVNLSYPITSMFNRKFTIQANFFGVETFDLEHMEMFYEKKQPLISNLKNVSLIVLQVRAERKAWWSDEDIVRYETDIPKFFKQEFNSSLIKVLAMSPSYVGKEVERAGMSLQPLIAVGFLIMTSFTVVTTIMSSLFVQQYNWHKITLAVTACVVPLMSVSTAFGMLFSIGVRFGPILAVTPLLILAIGVDDSFLMLHAWQRVVTRVREKTSVANDSIEKRISMVVAETGASITLSAVTNIFAFTVGALTSPPEIQLFSIVNAFALFVDTAYSFTLYAAIMAVCGKMEMREENDNYSRPSKFQEKVKKIFYTVIDWYINILGKIWIIVPVLTLLIGYWGISAYGALNMGIDLSSEKFFLKDSDLLEADKLKQKFVIPHFTAPAIFVNNPGNLSDINRVNRLESLVKHIESMPEAIGEDSTKFFLRDYADYVAAFSDPDFFEESHGDLAKDEENNWKFDADLLENFLAWPEYSYWGGFMKRNTNTTDDQLISKFFLTTGFHGERLKHWSQRHSLLDDWRKSVDAFPEFNVSIFYDDALFLDLVEVLPSCTWQSVVATLICMAFVCFVFFVDSFTVSMATMAIFSICLGEIGFLHFYGITLDPILMAALIMSIGFSVDIPCHICHHYYKTKFEEQIYDNEKTVVYNRLKHTLSAVGFPVMQAGISTNLCVLCFLAVPIYMGEVFVLCMLLCITLGILHGLLILPVIFHLQAKINVWRGKK